jgi:hypothetical protein
VSNYSQSTFFAPKDNLATGNPNKIIYGSDIDAELSAISTAIATKSESLDLTATTTDIIPDVDNNNDIGSATKRWADLYLSGGIYIGGTTSANYLDDYEEGTFTLNGTGSYLTALTGTVTGYYGQYTKVGRKVYLYGAIQGSTAIAINAGTGVGYVIFDSMPFASETGGFNLHDTTPGCGVDGVNFGFTTNKTSFFPTAFYASTWSWGATTNTGSTNTLSASVTYHTAS